jgi:transcriptional regulator with XRE-family HTH domain
VFIVNLYIFYIDFLLSFPYNAIMEVDNMKQARNAPNCFGSRLKELRIKRGLTMDQFCDQYNNKMGARLNKSTISRYENGTQEPMLTTVASFAEFFGVSPAYLIGESNEMNAASNISNSAVVQGNHATTLIVKNGGIHARELSDRAVELLRIFELLDVKRQTRLLTMAFELEEEMEKSNSRNGR